MHAVKHVAARPDGLDQSSAHQHGQVGGHGVGRGFELAGDFASGQAFAAGLGQQAKRGQAGVLTQGRQRFDRIIFAKRGDWRVDISNRH